MRGERLVVKLSRESHPEVFAIDKLTKHVSKLIEEFKGKRKLRDVVEFLRETEKSLGIVLNNHLRRRPAQVPALGAPKEQRRNAKRPTPVRTGRAFCI